MSDPAPSPPPSAEGSAGRPDEVAVLAPSGRDGALAVRVLGRWGMRAVAHGDVDALCAAVGRGIGAMVLAEEALHVASREKILTALAAQPSWSDIPIIILTAEGELSRVIAAGVAAIAGRGNVTLFERPVRVATLVTAVRSALRARARQYDVRDHLEGLRAARDQVDAARAEAEAARSAAEQANRAKSEFLAVMSHELRTPLNAIGGYAELLEMGIHGPVSESQREMLLRIQKSEQHLLGLINGVLNYARIETGTLRYEIVPVPLEEVLATAEALVAPQARAHGLALRFEATDDGLAALGDREKIQQIVLNLLSNAVKFTPAGGCVTTAAGRAPHGGVWVRVTDTGRGIAPEKLRLIFEPFVQVDAQLTRTQDGVGLGLAISRDLARGMGGDLTVESAVGAGSAFTLVLPAA